MIMVDVPKWNENTNDFYYNPVSEANYTVVAP